MSRIARRIFGAIGLNFYLCGNLRLLIWRWFVTAWNGGAKGHTLRQIASILNEQGWIPLKGRRFTERNIHGLLRSSDAAKILTPRRNLQVMLTKMERAHSTEHPGEPFETPSLAELAKLLDEAGYKTPRGKDHWWPAQVAQVMEGRFEGYYAMQNAEVDTL